MDYLIQYGIGKKDLNDISNTESVINKVDKTITDTIGYVIETEDIQLITETYKILEYYLSVIEMALADM